MPERADYHLSLDLTNDSQRQAWEILQAAKYGNHRELIANALLQSRQGDRFVEKLRKVLQEELPKVSVVPSEPLEKTEMPEPTGLPPGMMDFLGLLIEQ